MVNAKMVLVGAGERRSSAAGEGRTSRSAVWLLALAAAAGIVSGCGAGSSDIGPNGDAGGEAPGPCPDDGNACTLETREGGSCSSLPAPNGSSCAGGACRDGQCIPAGSGHDAGTPGPDAGPPDLVAHWRLDEASGAAALDSTPAGLHGAVVGSPARLPGVDGLALALDGVDDAVQVTAAAALNPFPLTVTAWIQTGAATLAGVVNKYAPMSQNGYQLFTSGGQLCAWYFRDEANHVFDGTTCSLATSGFNDRRWHHAAFVVDAAGGRLYVDGAQTAALPWTGTAGAATTSQPITLGRYPGAAGDYLTGAIDDVRIYARALDANEVAELYQQNAGAGSPDAGQPTAADAGPDDGGPADADAAVPSGADAGSAGPDGGPARGDASVPGRLYPPDEPMQTLSYPGPTSMPPYLAPVPQQAPFSANSVTRVSDQSAFASSPCAAACDGADCAHHYIEAAWNADQSLLLFNYCKLLLDGDDYHFIKSINPIGSGFAMWSNVDPKRIYSVNTNSTPARFVAVNPDYSPGEAGFSTTLVTLDGYTPNTITAGDRPVVDNQDQYAVVAGQRTSDGLWALLLVDIQARQVASAAVMTPGQNDVPTGCRYPHSMAISQSGKYARIDWSTNDGCSAIAYNFYDTTGGQLTYIGTIPDGGGHGDFCYDSAGNEVLVGSFGPTPDAGLYMRRLPSFTNVQVLPVELYRSYMHLSCRNVKRPGWAYISDDTTPLAQQGPQIWQRLFAVRLEPYGGAGGTVENFAWEHHPGDGGWIAPTAAPSPYGDKVIWKSNWDGTGPWYSYVANRQRP